MKRSIQLGAATVTYTLVINKRSRNVRLAIDPDKGLLVSIPNIWHERFVDTFLQQKSAWILKHLEKAKKYMDGKIVIRYTKEEYEKNKTRMLELMKERVEFFNRFYLFPYRKISIRNQTSLWGSCTRNGNLQFNYKLMYVPSRTQDYVVVHELCHVREHNHGPNFWKLVEKMIPEYKTIRKSLRQYIMREG